MSDMTMSETFDGEFLDMGGESFFDIVDQGGPLSHETGYVMLLMSTIAPCSRP
jgi:hypothetical protein